MAPQADQSATSILAEWVADQLGPRRHVQFGLRGEPPPAALDGDAVTEAVITARKPYSGEHEDPPR